MKRFACANALVMLCGLVLVRAGIAGGASSYPGADKSPVAHVSCTATNYPEIIVHNDEHNKKASEEEKDDWRVSCKITVGEEVIFNQAIDMPHPTEYRDAMDAIDEFRKKRAPQLIKDAAKK